jgi:serine/threonine protein kinase
MPSSITTLTAITRPASRGPNTPPPPEKGVLDGRYVLGDEIGSGGFAAVFRAFDRHLGIDVAIKVLKEHGVRDEEFRARFLREMTHHVLLRHPRIVPVLDRGVTPHGRLYFVMELLEGRSLSEHLRAQPGPRPWEEVVVVVKQLCEALETVHTRQIVHRDVKPGNVFVCGSGEDLAIRLLDLGIAKELPGAGISAPEEPSLTDVRVGVPGTPEYMAPEQIEGRPVDGRTDLYAVGVLMYRMLTGVLPFQPPDPLESEARHSWLARQHCEARPLRPSRRCPEAKIPAALEALVMSLLAKRASSRPQSARELRSALRQIERSLAHSAAEFAAWRRYVWRSLWWSTVALSCALFMLLDVPGVDRIRGWLAAMAPPQATVRLTRRLTPRPTPAAMRPATPELEAIPTAAPPGGETAAPLAVAVPPARPASVPPSWQRSTTKAPAKARAKAPAAPPPPETMLEAKRRLVDAIGPQRAAIERRCGGDATASRRFEVGLEEAGGRRLTAKLIDGGAPSEATRCAERALRGLRGPRGLGDFHVRIPLTLKL